MEQNPLREGLRLERVPDPHVMVLFGATGDLSHRKVFPALAQLWRTNLLPADWALLAQQGVTGSTGATGATGATGPTGGTGAAGIATIQCTAVTLFAAGNTYDVGDLINIAYGIRVQVTSISGGGGFGPIATIALVITAQKNSGDTVVNPSGINSTNSQFGNGAQFVTTWGVVGVIIGTPGAGYATPPAVAFSSGSATAVSVLGASGSGGSRCVSSSTRLVRAPEPVPPGRAGALSRSRQERTHSLRRHHARLGRPAPPFSAS